MTAPQAVAIRAAFEDYEYDEDDDDGDREDDDRKDDDDDDDHEDDVANWGV